MTTEAVIAKITNIIERDLSEIKEIISTYDQRLRVIELNTTKISSELYLKTNNLESGITEQKLKVSELERNTINLKDKLEATRNILNWVLGIITAISIEIIFEVIKRGLP